MSYRPYWVLAVHGYRAGKGIVRNTVGQWNGTVESVGLMENLKFYENKRVFVTGHTGFKGSWLCKILIDAGAMVTGYSLGSADDT